MHPSARRSMIVSAGRIRARPAVTVGCVTWLLVLSYARPNDYPARCACNLALETLDCRKFCDIPQQTACNLVSSQVESAPTFTEVQTFQTLMHPRSDVVG